MTAAHPMVDDGRAVALTPSLASAATPQRIPLVVDVDGTLVRGDLLWEGLIQLCARRPECIPGAGIAALHGIGALKEYVADTVPADIDTLPLNPAALTVIDRARAQGQTIVLASGAHVSHVAGLAMRVRADLAWGSSADVNLTGAAKLRRIRAEFDAFDYVGNAAADLPLWTAARTAYALDASDLTLVRARRACAHLQVLPSERVTWHARIRALRPHQWAKNLLLFLPALAAHVTFSPGVVMRLALGFIAFSALASSVYLLNDLVDMPQDRAHRTKRHRPIAAGQIPVPWALAAAAVLVIVAGSVSSLLPPAFQLVLAGYFATTTAYSLFLKTQPLVDVVTLAVLYAARLAAGAAAIEVPLSGWFIAFSMFFFLALALAKRVVELRDRPPPAGTASSRGYVGADLPLLSALGIAAAASSSLVYCLYITDGAVVRLYSRPDLLWLGLPIILYWQARVWLWTGRGWMHEDPVVFALRDRKSHLLFALSLLMMVLAA